MGWNTANDIFDPVCELLQTAHVWPQTKKRILVALIKALQEQDWDTEDESLERFPNDPIVVEAFRECGVEDVPFDNRPGGW